MAVGRSYVTNFNSNKPINPYHAIVQLYNKNGTWKDTSSCDTSVPIGSSNYHCNTSSYSIVASGSTSKFDVCLFYTSGQTNCTGYTSYTKS